MSATSPWEQEAYANAIAIVGMAGRFRGADTIEALWDVLRDGRETLHRMTGEELAAQDCPVPIMEHPCHVPVTAQLERADLFDANFFGFTPAEAAALAARMADFPHTALKGLMAIPPVSEFPGENCRYFAEMRNLFVDISRAMSVPALRAYSQVRLRVSTGFFTPGPRSAIT